MCFSSTVQSVWNVSASVMMSWLGKIYLHTHIKCCLLRNPKSQPCNISHFKKDTWINKVMHFLLLKIKVQCVNIYFTNSEILIITLCSFLYCSCIFKVKTMSHSHLAKHEIHFWQDVQSNIKHHQHASEFRS